MSLDSYVPDYCDAPDCHDLATHRWASWAEGQAWIEPPALVVQLCAVHAAPVAGWPIHRALW